MPYEFIRWWAAALFVWLVVTLVCQSTGCTLKVAVDVDLPDGALELPEDLDVTLAPCGTEE